MNILLDTHTFLWLVTDHPNASKTAKQLFMNTKNSFYLSAVCSFEIAVKYSLGKLELREPPQLFIHNRIKANSFIPLPITIEHSLVLADLPFHHRDPFDRLLIAQAIVEDIPILTADKIFSLYPAQIIW
jgi:PIN domain nuclease of toxin-antitoxin system